MAEQLLVREDTSVEGCTLELHGFRPCESSVLAKACVEVCGPVAYLDPIIGRTPEDTRAAIVPFTYYLLGERSLDKSLQVVTATIADPSDELIMEAYKEIGYSVVLDDKLTVLKALVKWRWHED